MTAAIDVAALKRLTDLSDVTAILQQVLAKDRAIQVELEQRLTHRKDMETELLSLTGATSDMLELGRADADQLCTAISNTATTAQAVSRRVRLLDRSQTNLVATLETIDLVITRSDCVAGVRAALDEGNYERAAEHVSTYQQLEEEAGDTAVGEDQAAEHAAILGAAREQLHAVVRTKIREATDGLDAATVVRFAKLYKPLKLTDEGLGAFTQFLRRVCHTKALEEYDLLGKRLEADPKSPHFLAALSGTLRAVYSAVHDHRGTIGDTFGAASVVAVVRELVQDLGTQGARVLHRFAEHRGLARLLQEVKSAVPPDAVLVDSVLAELRALVACSHEFAAATAALVQPAATSPEQVPSQDVAAAVHSGPFWAALGELQGGYVTLEGYYMETCLAKAIAIDTVFEGSLTSTVLDDSFYVLKHSCVRALSTGSSLCAAAVLGCAATLLGGPFQQALQGKLEGGAARLLAAALAEQPDAGAVGAAACPLNNAVFCVSYLGKMRAGMEAEAQTRFVNAPDYESVRASLTELANSGAALEAVSKRASDGLAEGMMARLRAPLDRLAKLSFTLSDADFSALEMDEGWSRPLCAVLEEQCERLSPYMAADAKQDVLAAVLTKLLQRIEAMLLSKKFNLFGGLCLDKEARSLVNNLTEITGLPVRDKSHRLRQLVTILTLESLDELADAWENDGLTWRLTAAEVKTVLSQRVEFDRQKIAALVL